MRREEAGVAVAELLRARRSEIEQAILTRTYGISDPTDTDPAYVEGLRESVSAALDYAVEAIERGEERVSPPPPELLAQARLAARSGIGLDTVLRRYVAGYTLLGDFLTSETQGGDLPQGLILPQLLQGHAAVLDRLLAAVSEEYEREAVSRLRSSEQRRAERVERLLAGEPIDTSSISYDFEGHHIGVIAIGSDAAEAVRGLAHEIDCRLLLVRHDEATVWAWLGSRRQLDLAAIEKLASSGNHARAVIAFGEPADDLSGWRLSHRQAVATLPIAQRMQGRPVRYSDVLLLAAVLRDDLLAISLRRLYLQPLQTDGNGGGTLLKVLRAYFAAGGNVSSAAAALSMTRRTVANRLGDVERTLGRPISTITADLEIALRLDDLVGDGGD